jgi:hypothetical protein
MGCGASKQEQTDRTTVPVKKVAPIEHKSLAVEHAPAIVIRVATVIISYASLSSRLTIWQMEHLLCSLLCHSILLPCSKRRSDKMES